MDFHSASRVVALACAFCFLLSCAGGRSTKMVGEVRQRSGESAAPSTELLGETHKRCLEILSKERKDIPKEDLDEELVYFSLILSSIYNWKVLGPEADWPRLREPIGPILLEVLSEQAGPTSKDLFKRGSPTKLAVGIGLKEAIPALRKQARSSNMYVSRRAIEALGFLGDAESVEFLRENLVPVSRSEWLAKGRDFTTPCYAAVALWRLGDTSGVQILSELLDYPAQSVRFHAAEAFAQMGDPRGLSVFEERLQTPATSKVPVLEAVGFLDGKWSRRILEDHFSSSQMRVRQTAAVLAAEKGSASGRRVLLRDLESEDPSTGYQAAIRLARLGDRRAVPALEYYYDRVDIERRLAAAAALASFGSRVGFSDLEDSLKYERWSYRAAAAALLLLVAE